MSRHILVVSQYFYPESFRINDICKEWVKRGYRVTVLTGIPNYPEGEYYKGYGLTKKRNEEWNGVKIIRIPLVARGHGLLGLVMNYMSFVASGFFWNCVAKLEADCVFTFEVSPVTQALIGVWYSNKHKVPHYLYVQDLWPENVEIVLGIQSRFILSPVEKMVEYIYRNCTRVFATSPSFVDSIRKRCKDQDKVSYWPQYAEEFYQPCRKRKVVEIPEDGCFKVIFTGNVGQAQGLEILTQAAGLLDGVKFVIVGDGRYRDSFIARVKESNVTDRFIMIGRQPAERIPELLACCDAAFLSFMENPLFLKTIPAKLQSYMACGMPIIAAAGGETERVITEAGCGLCSPAGNAELLAESIRRIAAAKSGCLEQMGRNALQYCREHFDKSTLMDEMDSFFFFF